MKTYFIPKHLQYGVDVTINDDGTLELKDENGDPIPNAVNLIMSLGGVSGFLERCNKCDEPLRDILCKMRQKRDIAIREKQKGIKIKEDARIKECTKKGTYIQNNTSGRK